MKIYIGLFTGLSIFVIGWIVVDKIGYYSLIPIVIGSLVVRWFVADFVE